MMDLILPMNVALKLTSSLQSETGTEVIWKLFEGVIMRNEKNDAVKLTEGYAALFAFRNNPSAVILFGRISYAPTTKQVPKPVKPVIPYLFPTPEIAEKFCNAALQGTRSKHLMFAGTVYIKRPNIKYKGTIIIVQSYQTTDGSLFKTKLEALEHQKKLDEQISMMPESEMKETVQ